MPLLLALLGRLVLYSAVKSVLLLLLFLSNSGCCFSAAARNWEKLMLQQLRVLPPPAKRLVLQSALNVTEQLHANLLICCMPAGLSSVWAIPWWRNCFSCLWMPFCRALHLNSGCIFKPRLLPRTISFLWGWRLCSWSPSPCWQVVGAHPSEISTEQQPAAETPSHHR